MILALLVLAVVALSYANGANDNFKGVATLFGGGTTDYRRAIAWATATTFLGSIAAVFLAETLLKKFTGRGLVDDTLVSQPAFVGAVAAGAGLTVLLATFLGLPISTTHGLVGALVGAGCAAGSGIPIKTLTSGFFGPLLVSPVLAIPTTAIAYATFRKLRRGFGVGTELCVCVGETAGEVAIAPDCGAAAAAVGPVATGAAGGLSVTVGSPEECRRLYTGRVVGIDAARLVDVCHYLSAGVVSFARGLNDTPKIAALLLLIPAFGTWGGSALVAVAMAIGGLVSARKVGETMSRKITPMNPGQGFSANLATGVIVLAASRFGLPVSTTHVSCGALFGIGLVNGQAEWRTIAKILTAWLFTLPLAAALGAAAFAATRFAVP